MGRHILAGFVRHGKQVIATEVLAHYLYELANWVAQKRLLRVVLVLIAIGMLVKYIVTVAGNA